MSAASITGLDHVQVAAPPGCETEARHFYGRLLGLPEIDKPEELRARGGLWFACGAQQLHVGVTPDFTPAGKAHPAFRVRPGGLEPLAARLAESGSAVRWGEAIAGVSRVVVDDPWGTRLELLAPGE